MAEGAPGSLGKSAEGRSQMELPAMAEDPYGSADLAPLPAGAGLVPNVGSAMSLHNGPVVDAVGGTTPEASAGGFRQVTLVTKCHP